MTQAPRRWWRDRALLLVTALAAFILIGLIASGGPFGRTTLRIVLGTAVALSLWKDWRARRQAKQEVDRAQHGDYRPFQDVASR